MEKQTLTPENAIYKLERTVEKFGEDTTGLRYRYLRPKEECVEGQPEGCLIGQMFLDMGVAREDFAHIISGGLGDQPIDRTDHINGWYLPASTRGLLQLAQRIQDRGDSWGNVLRLVKAHLTTSSAL